MYNFPNSESSFWLYLLKKSNINYFDDVMSVSVLYWYCILYLPLFIFQMLDITSLEKIVAEIEKEKEEEAEKKKQKK